MPTTPQFRTRAVLWTALLLLAAASGFFLARSQSELPERLTQAVRQLWEGLEARLFALWTWDGRSV